MLQNTGATSQEVAAGAITSPRTRVGKGQKKKVNDKGTQDSYRKFIDLTNEYSQGQS